MSNKQPNPINDLVILVVLLGLLFRLFHELGKSSHCARRLRAEQHLDLHITLPKLAHSLADTHVTEDVQSGLR